MYKLSSNSGSPNASSGWLFNIVYKTPVVRRVVFLLVLSFLIQPMHRAYADESVVADSPDVVVASAAEIQPVSVEIPVPPESLDITSDSEATSVGAANMDSPDGEPVWAESVVATTSAETNTSEAVSLESVGTSTNFGADVEEFNSASSTSTGSVEVLDAEVFIESDGSGQETSDATTAEADSESINIFSTSTASTTEDLEPILPLVHETFSDGEVRFKKDDCVQVDDGSYYCQPAVATGALRDAVLSAPDASGDLEIFLVKNGEYIQLTNNEVDDSAPYYDSQSETMVWHQFSGDNYVVQSFDFGTGEFADLTDGATNDMEPARYGDVTVWQRWIDGVWQIMLLRGGEVTQLTEGSSHHLTPSVYDGLVLWRTVEGSGVKVLESHDLKTGKHTIIDDPEEAAMVNPRMVMVYEAVYDNGDRVTRGVDIETGRIISLDTLPVDLPDTLPESDATGETRALIQSKPGTKETGSEAIEPVPVADPPTPPDPFTLVISSTTAAVSQGAIVGDSVPQPDLATTTERVLPTDFELVIPASTSTQPARE